MANFYLKA